MSKLDFKDCLPEPKVPEESIESFKKFVERLFFSPKLQRLECFRMHDLWVVDDDFLSIYNWLSAALQCKNHGRTVSVTWILEFPHLKTLILDLADADGVFESPPEQVPSCLLYHLKEISLVSFKRLKDTHVQTG
ncbi:hypothetical protein GQ457_14G023530 [Hibiscus cannabinus]